MFKKHILPILLTLAAGFIYFYFALPVFNIRASSFWGFLLFLAVFYLVVRLLCAGRLQKYVDVKGRTVSWPSREPSAGRRPAGKRVRLVIGVAAAAALAAGIGIWVSSSQMFRAASYQKMLTVEEGVFQDDIAELSFSQIPVVDKDTAQRLGSRKIGDMVELVSQFSVSDLYTQINYQQKPFRVSPLEYASFFKWIANREEGIPYYVTIDMASQDTQMVRLEEGMKYSPSEYLGRDLMRHIRFQYPTKMIYSLSFEIDDQGHPYWTASVYDYTIGFLGGKDITGLILVDAVTGETVYHDVGDVPQWLDQVFPADLVVEQADYWGKYGSGYWNTVFSQKGVVTTTEGYNYIAVNDDVWLFTGITSVVSDKSNIGFIMVNLRTKECKRYTVNGAEEFSAMSSAEGKVQEKGYRATFPILMNIADQPTYFISLKDNAGLVKAYSFVSVVDYQIVGVGDTLEAAQSEYIRLLGAEQAPDQSAAETAEGVVARVATAVKEGDSYYYITLAGDDRVYGASIQISDRLPILAAGDRVSLSSLPRDDGFREVVSIALPAAQNTGAPAASDGQTDAGGASSSQPADGTSAAG